MGADALAKNAESKLRTPISDQHLEFVDQSASHGFLVLLQDMTIDGTDSFTATTLFFFIF